MYAPILIPNKILSELVAGCGGGLIEIHIVHSDRVDDRFYIDVFEMSGCSLFELNTCPPTQSA